MDYTLPYCFVFAKAFIITMLYLPIREGESTYFFVLAATQMSQTIKQTTKYGISHSSYENMQTKYNDFVIRDKS